MDNISIIIPVKEVNAYNLKYLPLLVQQLKRGDEILLIPDVLPQKKLKGVKCIASGPGGPAMKRDLGADHARGTLLAFIDDDAYPGTNWLTTARKAFEDQTKALIGGPNITPPHAGTFEHLSGAVLSSPLVSGPAALRYGITGTPREATDLPSCNLFIRKDIFKKVKGFDTSFWPGEDSKLCADVRKAGYALTYYPALRVFHHRRSTLKGYCQQIASYARHRGYFFRKNEGDSRKIAYCVPSLFVLSLIAWGGLVLSETSSLGAKGGFLIVGLYALLLLIEGIRVSKKKILSFMALAFVTHCIYGALFLKGLCTSKLKSTYRQ